MFRTTKCFIISQTYTVHPVYGILSCVHISSLVNGRMFVELVGSSFVCIKDNLSLITFSTWNVNEWWVGSILGGGTKRLLWVILRCKTVICLDGHKNSAKTRRCYLPKTLVFGLTFWSQQGLRTTRTARSLHKNRARELHCGKWHLEMVTMSARSFISGSSWLASINEREYTVHKRVRSHFTAADEVGATHHRSNCL